MPKINIKNFQVDENNPLEHDIFHRETLIKSVVNLADHLDESLVMGFNAPWGHGKSVLIDRLIAYVKKEHDDDYGIIKYDAFRHDFISDVFISISSSITEYLETQENSATNDQLKQDINKVKNEILKQGTAVCKSVIKNSIVRGIKYTTAGLVDLAEIDKDIEEGLEEAVNDNAESITDGALSITENIIKERLVSASKDQDLIFEYTFKLEEAIKKTEKKCLIFIIDELDRCHPSFAVEVLEKIKHFFSCKNILFILVYNKKQLERTISHIYGVDDPNIYLQRFIDLEANISIKINAPNGIDEVKQYVNWLVVQHDFTPIWRESIARLLSEAFVLLESQMSLRAIDKVCSKLASYCLINDDNFIYDQSIVTFLAILLVTKPEIYSSIKNRAVIIKKAHGENVLVKLESSDENINKLSKLMKSHDELIFIRLYDFFLYYLYLIDGENQGQELQSPRGFVEREKCINHICSLLEMFQME